MVEVIKVDDCGSNIGDYDIPIHNAIIIPKGATNGDMIKAMFPNLIITVCSEAKPIPYVMVIGENYEYNLTYPLDWWNAPYKVADNE